MKTAENNGVTCSFDPKWHTYTLGSGKRLTSVTRHMKQYQKPFDPDGIIAERCGAKMGISGDEMAAQWQEKGRKACEKGNIVHAWLENRFTGKTDPADTDILKHAEQVYNKLSEKFTFIEAEKIFFCPELMIAGTADLIMQDHDDIVIMDYKTNHEYRMTNQWENLLHPYSEFDASHLNLHSLQLAIYRKLAEIFYPGKNIRTGIIWIHDNGFQFINPNTDICY